MIISHRLKFAYFRIPKTASNTTGLLLRCCGVFDENDFMTPFPKCGFAGTPGSKEWGHGTPKEAICGGLITAAQLREYYCVAGLREPTDRYMSAFSHAARGAGQMEHMIKRYDDLGLLGTPMLDWFTHEGDTICEPIWFDDLHASLFGVIERLGGHIPKMVPHINPNTFGTVPALDDYFNDKSILAKVHAALEPDIKFYNTMLSRR